MSSGRVDKSS